MASAKDCKTLHEVRVEIDRLDEQIIRLLGERAEYVHAAARFKTSEEHVAAPDRQRAMLEVRRAWAEREGRDRRRVPAAGGEMAEWRKA